MATVRYSDATFYTALRDAPRSRAAGYWGWTFLLLLLVSAGMASVPEATDAPTFVRHFYTAHTDVIIASQVLSLLASVAIVPFVLTLRRGPRPRHRGLDVEVTGLVMAAVSMLTAVPVLVLCKVADTASASDVHGLTVLCDLADVALFFTIALWSWTLVGASTSRSFGLLAGVVALLSLARAWFLLTRSPDLELVAPLAFVALVVVLSAAVLVRHSPVPPR